MSLDDCSQGDAILPCLLWKEREEPTHFISSECSADPPLILRFVPSKLERGRDKDHGLHLGPRALGRGAQVFRLHPLLKDRRRVKHRSVSLFLPSCPFCLLILGLGGSPVLCQSFYPGSAGLTRAGWLACLQGSGGCHTSLSSKPAFRFYLGPA